MRKAKMILRTVPGGIVLFLLLSGSIAAQDDDSLAGSFLSENVTQDLIWE
ncbi:hypothetical protein WN51_11441 [Melipona quadrifasciata]|uniref:Uncharacterized protein n=1 Tax=Melipona quadrifasciata TaxID=166423 RepID=A0A0M9A9A0_9HYME|nr:hypothetical protein WN51_11441 [Melipona quadrifasciata]